MANLNKVMLIGNLTRDPVIKYLPSGTPVTEFGLATNRRYRDQQSGENREITTFVDCKCMGRGAEVFQQYMGKGRQVFIEGRLEFRSWEAKDGSGRRSKLDVFVENFQFLDGGRQDGGAPSAGGGQGGGRPRPEQAGPAAEAGFGGGGDAFGGGAPGGAGFGPVDDETPF